MKKYYPLRRVPHTVSRTVLWKSLTPLVGPVLKSGGRSVLAKVPLPSQIARDTLQEKARIAGDEVVEKAQHIFFDNPGLDTLVVRSLNRVGRAVVQVGRFSLVGRIILGMDKDGRLRDHLELLPSTGYDSLMVSGLAAGTALGMFRGGPVDSLIWWDSADPDRRQRRQLPDGHPYPSVRRFQPPRTLGDLAADIDDLYWAEAYGQAVKVTRVGEGKDRRWLVSLPGTDHSQPESEPNPADIESNLREELNLPSAMRVGTVHVIKRAMAANGLSPEEMVSERVLICGHSQGGMVAAALAASDPEDVGFTVDAVLTLGSPTRRLRLRDGAQMLAVEHIQDIVPALDGTPRRVADQRVVVEEELNKPIRGPLFYAHASSTYTDTVRQIEREAAIAPWGRSADVVRFLQEYLPRPEEPWRVTHHYVWQDLVEPTKASAWNTYLEMNLPQEWEPVTFEGEIVAPALKVPDPHAVLNPDEIKAVLNPDELKAKAAALLHLHSGEEPVDAEQGAEESSDEGVDEGLDEESQGEAAPLLDSEDEVELGAGAQSRDPLAFEGADND